MSPRRRAFRDHWPLLVLLIVVVASFIASLVTDLEAVEKTAGAIATFLSIATSIVMYAYARVDRFRLTVDRARLTLWNTELTWSLVAEYGVPEPRAAFAEIEATLSALASQRIRRVADTRTGSLWNLNGSAVYIRMQESGGGFEDDDEYEVRIEFPSIRRSFRGLTNVITDEVGPLLGKLEQTSHLTRKKYVVRLEFGPGGNPYYGLFITNVAPINLTRFSLEFVEPSLTERDVVRVSKEKLEIVTETAAHAKDLSLRYMSLSTRAVESP